MLLKLDLSIQVVRRCEIEGVLIASNEILNRALFVCWKEKAHCLPHQGGSKNDS